MTTISMFDFRRDSDAVILKVQQGETVVLTDDGKPAVRLEPIAAGSPAPAGDSLRSLGDLAARWDNSDPANSRSLTDREIDTIVYGL